VAGRQAQQCCCTGGPAQQSLSAIRSDAAGISYAGRNSGKRNGAAAYRISQVSTTRGAQIMASAPHLHLTPEALYPFDARGIAKRFRHSAIFGALDALNPGETMRFINDHDPLPLLDQLALRYGGNVTVRYVQREPGAIAIDFVKN
jgi:uncharacterized protein (DUF2249 family)